MSRYDFDLFVMGAGSGGVRAARMSAGYGAKVAVAEDRYLGGTCVNVGCVPKKLFVHASHYSEDYQNARGFGWGEASPSFDWQVLIENKNAEIARLNGIYGDLLADAGVTRYDGRAEIQDEHHIKVNGEVVSTDKILIATGGWPTVPEFEGREFAITSNEAFFLPALPERALVYGGGYIAVEFAGIFAGVGVDATLAYRGPLFLRGFDLDVRETVRDELLKKDIRLRFDTRIARVETHGDEYRVTFEGGESIETGLVLCATGRAPAVQGIGLETVPVETRENGAIVVDEEFRTSVPNIFALGDVIDRIQLTPVAIAEAMCFAATQFGGARKLMDYDDIATAVFCQPNIGTVGLTEEQARAAHGNVQVYRSAFRPLKHTLSGSDERTMMKILVDGDTDRVIGAHMVGAEAGEIIQGLAVAMKAGVTKAQLDATVGIHPTTAEEFVTLYSAS